MADAVNANAEWQHWIDLHWPNATSTERQLLWSLWMYAVACGRRMEKQGVSPVKER